MKTKVIIIGGRGTAVVIAEQLIDAIERYHYDAELIGFAFDDPDMTEVIDMPILCHSYEVLDKYGKYDDVKFIYQLYRPDLIKVRSELRDSFNIPLEKYMNFIHPTAYVAHSAKLGFGNVLLANTVINSHAVIGNFNTFNSGDLVGHDTVIGDSNYSAAQVCIGSGLHIGNMNFLGLNCSLRNELTIGNECIVGMASNVTRSLHDKSIVYGNPAREKEQLNNIIR
ncbi:MAG: sialic acid O-acetyltransferase [Prevotella sp.]|nr:sialic acid O-acetyltransferase [Prevotella sp.]